MKYRQKLNPKKDKAYYKNTANRTHVKNLITSTRGGKQI